MKALGPALVLAVGCAQPPCPAADPVLTVELPDDPHLCWEASWGLGQAHSAVVTGPEGTMWSVRTIDADGQPVNALNSNVRYGVTPVLDDPDAAMSASQDLALTEGETYTWTLGLACGGSEEAGATWSVDFVAPAPLVAF